MDRLMLGTAAAETVMAATLREMFRPPRRRKVARLVQDPLARLPQAAEGALRVETPEGPAEDLPMARLMAMVPVTVQGNLRYRLERLERPVPLIRM